MNKKARKLHKALSYVLTICLSFGSISTTVFAKSTPEGTIQITEVKKIQEETVHMTEATKPKEEKTVPMTEVEKPKKQKTMQVTDIETQETKEVEIEEEPKKEEKQEPIETTLQTTEQTSVTSEIGETLTATGHNKVCDGNHSGWKELTAKPVQNNYLNSGMYYLNSDVTLPETLTINGDVTLCLNGHTLKLTEDATEFTDSSVISVARDAKLSLFDEENNSGKITGGKNSGIRNQGILTMYGGSISDNISYAIVQAGGGVYNSGTFTMNGGSISNNEAENGGGICNYAMFTMNGGSISQNKADNHSNIGTGGGGGVYNSGTFTMNDGSISKNSVVGYNDSVLTSMKGGGGIFHTENSKFFMSGGSITENVAENGGGMYTYRAYRIIISGGSISNNTAEYGGGIYNCSISTINGGSISNNKSNMGGGIYNPGTLTVTNGSISNNEVNFSSGGGGIYNSGSFSVRNEPIITENYFIAENSERIRDNVFLCSSKYIKVTGGLGEKANIGVIVSSSPTEGNPIKIAIADEYKITANDTLKFISDNSDYKRILKDKSVWLSIDGEEPDPNEPEEPEEPSIHEHTQVCNKDHTGWAALTSETLPSILENGEYSLKDGMYYLNDDITLSDQITVCGNVTLCLNGHTLELAKDVDKNIPVITITYRAKLTLFDREDNSGKITGGKSSGIMVYGRIRKSPLPAGQLIMYGGTICDNETSDDGGGISNLGDFVMYGGSICHNKAKKLGGGICNSVYDADSPYGKFIMNGGSISHNEAGNGGGVWNTSYFTMNGGSITNNKAIKLENSTNHGDGGGVDNYHTFTMNNGSISNNSADWGGGVHNRGIFTMKDGSIADNKAVNTGGVCNNSAIFTIAGGSITGNKAVNNGGGIYHDDYDPAHYETKFNMSGSPVITGNFIVKNEEASSGTANNVYLFKDYRSNSTICIDGALDTKANIGVTVTTPPTEKNPIRIAISSNKYTITKNDLERFTSDNDNYIVTRNGDFVYLEIGDEKPTLPSEKVTITFDMQYDSEVQTQQVNIGTIITEPTPPTRDDYEFVGWFTDIDYTQEYKFDVSVTEDMILYAKWEKVKSTPPEKLDKFTVIFDSNGGLNIDSQIVEDGKTLKKPTDPTKYGYIFDGWYKEDTFVNKWNFGIDVVTTDIILFAKWVENKTPTPIPPTITTPTIRYYTITFNSNGGSEVTSQTVKRNETAVMPTEPAKNGYEFLGWFIDEDFNEIYRFTTPVTKDVTLYAKWKANETADNYSITFDSNGGTKILSQTVKRNETAVMPSEPTKNGYEFLGWFTDKNFNEVYRFTTPVTENITLYAKWKAKSSHSSSGGGGGGSSHSSSGGGDGGSSSGSSSTNNNLAKAETQTEQAVQEVKSEQPNIEAAKTKVLSKFTDIDTNSWYYDGVNYCVEKGLMFGTSDTNFSPDKPITRTMLITILWRIEGQPISNNTISFQDVKEYAYYTEAIRWATQNNIISGYNNTLFGIDDDITREQMATILYRYTYYKNKDISRKADITNYTDKNEISSYALTAIQWACDTGIINGISTTILSPKGTTTRAQAAQIFKEYLEQQL